MTYKNFANLMRQKREKMGYLQKEFAMMIPISNSQYNKIENGLREPNFAILQRICVLLEIDLTRVLELDIKPDKKYLDID